MIGSTVFFRVLSHPVALIFGVGLLAIQFFGHTGMCLPELRYLSQTEFENAAILDKIRVSRLRSVEDKQAALTEFWNQYPNCCRRLAPILEDIVARFFGIYGRRVEVTSRIRGSGSRDYRSFYLVNACGTVLEEKGYES